MIIIIIIITEIIKNITKVESNILLVRSTQQGKWYLAEVITTQTCFAKNVF